MRPRPKRLERLPEQYFGALLARVTAAAALDGEPIVDLGRGNPETGPPQHVVDALAEAANRPTAHGYAPFRGLPELRAAIAERYRTVYGVELDPDSEVAVVPGTKTAIVELSLALAERGSTVVLPDPWYPDYPSGPALAGAELATVPLDPAAHWQPDFARAPRDGVAALYLNYPSNACAAVVRDGTFERAIDYAHETDAAVVHDFAYADLLFDGRGPQSFLATPGAKEVAKQHDIEVWDFRDLLRQIADANRDQKAYFTDDTARTIQNARPSRTYTVPPLGRVREPSRPYAAPTVAVNGIE